MLWQSPTRKREREREREREEILVLECIAHGKLALTYRNVISWEAYKEASYLSQEGKETLPWLSECTQCKGTPFEVIKKPFVGMEEEGIA